MGPLEHLEMFVVIAGMRKGVHLVERGQERCLTSDDTPDSPCNKECLVSNIDSATVKKPGSGVCILF